MFYKLYKYKGNFNRKAFVSARKERELICHKFKKRSWKKGHCLAEVATVVRCSIEKLLKMLKKTVAKLTSENYQWRNSILIDLLNASEFFSN